mgnify:CR=1 FL=1
MTTAVATLPQAHSFPALLKQYQAEIARALPRHLSPDRIVRVALTAFRLNPKLADVDPRSVFAAVEQMLAESRLQAAGQRDDAG